MAFRRTICSIACFYCQRKETSEVCYFISSTARAAEVFAQAIKDHGKLETTPPGTLDVTFGEDASRLRKDHGAENLGLRRRIAISRWKNDNRLKMSIKGKRLLAGWNKDSLLKILFQIPQGKCCVCLASLAAFEK